jgi:lipid-A-disaccharide synthase
VLIQYRKLLKKLELLRASLRKNKPDLLIIIDYPDFNLKLAETAKEMGVPVLFYISPQVWAWRSHRVHRIGTLVSMMAVIFPFEVAFYEKASVPVQYVGHPLVDEVHSSLSKAQAREKFELPPTAPVLAILPGSRDGEVKRVLPIMLKVVDQLRLEYPHLKVLLPCAGTLDKQNLNALLQEHRDITVIEAQAYDVMMACDAVLSASGTATLETAMMNIPLAIVYKINPISYAIMSRMIRIDNIGLVNIVAGKRIVQEYIQHQAKPQAIAAEVSRLLSDTQYTDKMREELKAVRLKMGTGGASVKVAKLVLGLLENHTQ